MKLLFQAIIKFILGVLMIGLLLFWPAGTFYYWNAWLLMGLYDIHGYKEYKQKVKYKMIPFVW